MLYKIIAYVEQLVAYILSCPLLKKVAYFLHADECFE